MNRIEFFLTARTNWDFERYANFERSLNQEDETRNDGEARNDFWSVEGVALSSSRSSSNSPPRNITNSCEMFVDAIRNTHTKLDVLHERRIKITGTLIAIRTYPNFGLVSRS